MALPTPKFVTFDMNGTLIHYRMDDAVRRVLGDRLPPDIAEEVTETASRFRTDECMGEWKPFHQVIDRALRRAMQRYDLEYREGDGMAIYDQIPAWSAYPGVPEALRRVAERIPLVIVTNTDDAQVSELVSHLEAPFEVVITSEQMGVYKPRLAAFEFLLDKLGVAADEIVHVSASPEYDLRPASDVGIKHKVYLDRGFEPDQPWLGYERITDVADLPAALGL